MPTGIVTDGEAHFAHPAEEQETFCGLAWSHDKADRVFSGAYYVEYISEKLSREEDVPICTDCVELGEEWAAPNED